MPLTWQLEHQRLVIPGPLVLRNAPIKYPAPAEDKDRTVLRRSEPNSRTTLTGEQPDPWDLLQPQDVMSRHRGAKQRRRYGRLGAISLLCYQPVIPRVPFIRWATTIPHSIAGSLGPAFATARPVGLTVKHTSTLTLYTRLPTVLSVPSGSSVTI